MIFSLILWKNFLLQAGVGIEALMPLHVRGLMFMHCCGCCCGCCLCIVVVAVAASTSTTTTTTTAAVAIAIATTKR